MSGWYDAHQILFQTTAIYVVLALSFQVVLRSGVFSFLSVGFFGAGGYVVADMTNHGMPGVGSIMAAVGAAAIIGYGLSLPLVRLRGLYLGMVTFAIDQIVIVVADNGGSLTGGTVGIFGIPLVVNTAELWIIAGACVLVVSQLERRSHGRSIDALRVDEMLARSIGVQVRKERNMIFALSAALGSLAGAMHTLTFSTISTTGFGFGLIVSGLTMAVVGGVISWIGAVVGAVIVAWFPQVFSFVGGYRTIVYGMLVIVVVAYEPNGIIGLVQRGWRWMRRGRMPRTVVEAAAGPPAPGSGRGPGQTAAAS